MIFIKKYYIILYYAFAEIEEKHSGHFSTVYGRTNTLPGINIDCNTYNARLERLVKKCCILYKYAENNSTATESWLLHPDNGPPLSALLICELLAVELL